MVADILSFEGSERGKYHPIAFDSPANDELTQRFLTQYPSQVPANFAISQLPTEILSWSMQVLQLAELSLMADRRVAMNLSTGPGEDGEGTAGMWVTPLTHSSLSYPTTKGTFSSGHSSGSIGKPHGTQLADLRALVASQWSLALCGKPQATWLRRFGTRSGSAPCTSRDQRTCDHSSDHGCRPARTSIPPNNNNELLPATSAIHVQPVGSGKRNRHEGRSRCRDSNRRVLLRDEVLRDNGDANAGTNEDHKAKGGNLPRCEPPRDPPYRAPDQFRLSSDRDF